MKELERERVRNWLAAIADEVISTHIARRAEQAGRDAVSVDSVVEESVDLSPRDGRVPGASAGSRRRPKNRARKAEWAAGERTGEDIPPQAGPPQVRPEG